jgi:predicted N-formylglutamate amidohydrolase
LLDATIVLQNWSRLVVDCNRPPQAPDAISLISDGTPIPGNVGLDAAAIAARRQAIFDPYHRAITDLVDARRDTGRPVRLLMMHSFTPVYGGMARPWPIGVLYGRDARLASILLPALRKAGIGEVGDNQPYDVSDETDYAVPVHGEARGLLHVELELRQDLISDDAGQRKWARTLQGLLQSCESSIAALGGIS